MIRYLSKLACMVLICMLPIKAMGPQVEDIQEQRQTQDPKSLVVQALLKVARSPQITDEQIEQLPQELKKIARLISSTHGDITKALFKAIEVRCDILKFVCKLEKLQSELRLNFNYQNLLFESYSIDDIYMILQCASSAVVIDCNSKVKGNDGTKLLLKICKACDAELLMFLNKEQYKGSVDIIAPNDEVIRKRIEGLVHNILSVCKN